MNACASVVLALVTAAAERLGLRGAEFLDGQGQFVVAGADRVVDVDHDRLGQIVEGVDRHRGQRVGVGRDPLVCAAANSASRRLRRRRRIHSHSSRTATTMIASTTSRPNHEIPAPVLRRRVEPVGRGDRGTRPSRPGAVPGSMSLRRMSSVSVDVPPVTAFGTSNAYRPFFGGDRQQRIVVAEIA